MAGRHTFANDDQRERYELDTIADHATRIADVEARPLPPGSGTAADISQVDSGDAASAGATGRSADAGHQHAVPAPGAPTTSAVADATSAGASTTLARSDHRHGREAFGGTPATSAVGDGGSAGSATTPPRSDHQHPREGFGVPGSSAVADTAAAGVATTVSRSDHRHAREGFGSGQSTQINVGDAALDGVQTTLARADHQHEFPAPTTPPSNSGIGDSAALGASDQVARANHVHGREGTGAPTTSAVGDTSAVGVSASVSRSDHRHEREAFASPIALTSSTTGSAGTATTLPRSDHRHAFPDDVMTTPSQTGKRSHSGSYSGTTDASAFLVVTHGAGFTPTQVFVQSTGPSGGANQGYPVVTAITATTFTIRYLVSAGTTASIGVTGYYECRA